MLSDLEEKVISKVARETKAAESSDTICKLYRQARLWVRFRCHYEGAITESHAEELHLELKRIRGAAKKRLGVR